MEYSINQYLLTDSRDDELATIQYTTDRDLNRQEIEETFETFRIAREINENEDVSDLVNFKL